MPTTKQTIQANIDAVQRIPMMNTLLEIICRTTGMGFAVVARVTDEQWVACAVNDKIDFGLKPGDELQLETTLCQEVNQARKEIVIDHVAKDEKYANHHTPLIYGFQSYISMPIVLRNGSFFGTLCAIDPRPALINNPETIGMFKLYTELISFYLTADEELAVSQIKLLEGMEIIQSLNEELAISNSELKASNIELLAKNDELHQAQDSLYELNNQLEDRIAERTKELSESEAMKSIAIEQAKLGTWTIDAATREFFPSIRLKEIFGYHANEVMPYETAITQITEEYRDKVTSAVNNAITEGESYDLEYPIIGYHDKKLRWVRATGRLYDSGPGKSGHFSGTILDITEQKQDEQRKNDFIGMVSHELKTPLTSAKAYVQLLASRMDKSNDSFSNSILEKVDKHLSKMNTMINGFLNVSRLESGKLYIDKQRFNMADLVKEAEEEAVSTFTSHQIVFAPVDPIFVNADWDKTGHVINNLISNAVKYSNRNTTINVACIAKDGSAQVSVSDEGMGIKPSDMEKLFDRYYRVQGSETKLIAGFGIGLYLCKEIVERLGGKIWAESEFGKGSTFYFTIPEVA